MTSLNPRLEGQGRNARLRAKPSRLMVQGGGLVTRMLGSGPCSATDSLHNVEAKLHPNLLSYLVPHLLSSVVPHVRDQNITLRENIFRRAQHVTYTGKAVMDPGHLREDPKKQLGSPSSCRSDHTSWGQVYVEEPGLGYFYEELRLGCAI